MHRLAHAGRINNEFSSIFKVLLDFQTKIFGHRPMTFYDRGANLLLRHYTATNKDRC